MMKEKKKKQEQGKYIGIKMSCAYGKKCNFSSSSLKNCIVLVGLSLAGRMLNLCFTYVDVQPISIPH